MSKTTRLIRFHAPSKIFAGVEVCARHISAHIMPQATQEPILHYSKSVSLWCFVLAFLQAHSIARLLRNVLLNSILESRCRFGEDLVRGGDKSWDTDDAQVVCDRGHVVDVEADFWSEDEEAEALLGLRDFS